MLNIQYLHEMIWHVINTCRVARVIAGLMDLTVAGMICMNTH